MPSVIFESVDNQYEWGTYFDLKVLIMTRNGYINATRMCKDGNKQFKYWLQNDSSRNLLKNLEVRGTFPPNLF